MSGSWPAPVAEPIPPELRPLPFDEAAAAAAILACHVAAASIEAARAERDGCAGWAREEWRGPAREQADVELTRLDAQGSDLRARLISLAASVAAARDEVAARNRARAAALEQWLAETAGG